MEGQSSHASVNPNSSVNTSSDAGTGIKYTNGDMAWEWGVWIDPTKKEIFGVHFVTRKCLEGSQESYWSDVREAMGGNVDIEPSKRSKRERYRDDDDEISVGGGLEEEVNVLDEIRMLNR
ncbi:hypothetical protein Tco_1327712 [Tanacetum coccineum]